MNARQFTVIYYALLAIAYGTLGLKEISKESLLKAEAWFQVWLKEQGE